MKPIAVIILNWNGANLLREFLPKVVENTNHTLADVIVADNGSTDNSLQLLRDNLPEVKVIAYPENYGFAEGYNRAIADT
ncbi:MAG: glycosyltransferase, partial [Muribaculaceae bacterium]|nr:glycosyltransferase [Muribaculaceae bacterium]